MSEFFEIDLLDVETKDSGDAITIRYGIDGSEYVHVVDGGFDAVGERIIEHIIKYYGDRPINHMVVTHPDGDHACGLRHVLERCNVQALWMLRPWQYASYIIGRFDTYNSVDRLQQRLRQAYPYIASLEEIALRRGIPIFEPFQGQRIGAFTVLAPSVDRYLDLIVRSTKTPDATSASTTEGSLAAGARGLDGVLWKLMQGVWGNEVFSPNGTSAENEMSVVQYAYIAEKKIVLTGDAGREALTEAADYAPYAGLLLPGVDRFQVPHHGSRRNVSTELLDRWLGPRLPAPLPEGSETFTAMCSAAKADPHHPRPSVERAMCHRGAKFITSENGDVYTYHGLPLRPGWSPLASRPYPPELED